MGQGWVPGGGRIPPNREPQRLGRLRLPTQRQARVAWCRALVHGGCRLEPVAWNEGGAATKEMNDDRRQGFFFILGGQVV